ncbi:MAG: hypothetical protein M0Z95_10250 [Actinomycetota bacterium]|nr:hypothetical protein [Actinomycetota bacterium]
MPEPARVARGALPIVQMATIVGGYCWIERRLFEVTGRWASDPVLLDAPDAPGASRAPAAIRLHFDELRVQHARHSAEWADRLPLAHGFDRRALTVAPNPGVEAAIRLLEAGIPAAGHDEHTPSARRVLIGRLAGLHRVILPRLVAGYERHRSAAVPVADRPISRVLDLVLRDEEAALRDGEALLEAVLKTPAEEKAAAGAVGALESTLDRSRIEAGLVDWPAPPSGDRGT